MEPPEHARAAAPGAAGDPLVGRLLDGRYRIASRIARGGMASVYEATDTRLDRTVAVKVMHPGLGDDQDFAQRFVREARAAARLNHPHVVGVYDQGDDTSDGTDTVFLVMEYVPGHTLRDVVRKEAPMAPQRALALLEPVVSALAAAHRAGLVHRDVKPENVLIEDEAHGGRVKVADFGLAKAVSADTQHTATGGVLIGTVSYLAPELVVDGRSDARADVYAAGVVLYELLTGSKPHEGESPIQVAYRHVHHDVPAPSLRQPGIPDYVDALVARATSRDRAQRPADATVLLHHLHRVAQALRDGLASDPELAADLLPRRTPEPAEAAGAEDTTPEPFDARALALLTEVDPRDSGLVDDGSPDRTTALERHAVTPSPADAGDGPAPTTAVPTLPRPAPPAAAPAATGPGTATTAPPTPGTAAPRTSLARPGAAPTTARRRSRRGPLLLVLALLLACAVGGGAYWFGWERYTTTPAVLGLDEAAAGKELGAAGLDAEVGEPAYSENVAPGLVIATDPGPGGRVLDGGTVTLTLSLGPERYDVPDLRGQTEDQAQDALAATKLAFGSSVGRWSETVPEGQVIRTSPAIGTTLKPGATVDLVLSRGRKPIEVKDYTGKSLDAVRTALGKRELEVSVTAEEYSDSVPDGAIISQDPPPGTTLYRGDTVSFVVSLGPELVEVPQVRAMGVDAATDLLEGLGFQVETEQADGYLGLGFVFSSDPGQGESVPKGSTITLSLI